MFFLKISTPKKLEDNLRLKRIITEISTGSILAADSAGGAEGNTTPTAECGVWSADLVLRRGCGSKPDRSQKPKLNAIVEPAMQKESLRISAHVCCAGHHNLYIGIKIPINTDYNVYSFHFCRYNF